MPRSRPPSDLASVVALKRAGKTDREVSAETAVPVTTIRAWRRNGASRAAEQSLAGVELCAACDEPAHDFGALPAARYAYALGVYLGDGCLTAVKSSWSLRVTLDEIYPGIVAECQEAFSALRGHDVQVWPQRGERCVVVTSSWRSWPCLFPQHGPGRKHQRQIQLEPWQQAIVDQAPGAFLRGLIHTDGWRGVNRVVSKGKAYEYPRYQFSNRSDDIRKLFTDACEALGVAWRQWTRYHVSVAKRESVALLDTFVGPKY